MISVDLGTLENDLASFHINNSFELLNMDKALVALGLVSSLAPLVLEKEEVRVDKAPVAVTPGLPLVQTTLLPTSPLSTLRKRGRKPKHTKTKLEIDEGIQSTIISSLETSTKKRSKKPFSPPLKRALATKRSLHKVFSIGLVSPVSLNVLRGADASPQGQ